MTIHAVPRALDSEPKLRKRSIRKGPVETPLGRHLRGLAVAYERASKNPEKGAGLRQAADVVDAQVSGSIHHEALLEMFSVLVAEMTKAITEVRELAADLASAKEIATGRPVASSASNVDLDVYEPTLEEGAVIGPAVVVRRQRVERPNVAAVRDVEVNGLPAGQAKVLAAVASFKGGITREHVTILTGFKQSTRNAYILRLSNKNYVRVEGERVVATATGQMKLGPGFKRVPRGRKAADHWAAVLPEGEAAVFDIVRKAWPKSVPRARISALTGYKESTRNAYILRLRTRELVRDVGDGVVLRDELGKG